MKIFLTMVLSVFTMATAMAAALPSRTDVSLLKEVEVAQERGLNWLSQQQQPDGSWHHHPAITAMAATAFLRAGQPLASNQQAAVDHALKFIMSNVKTNGAIYGGGESDKYPNYSTAICTMALLAAGKPEYTETIRKARAFLLDSQFDEKEHVKESDASYGGIGYGKRERPDLSNMQWALEAIRLTESLETQSATSPHTGSRLHWQKAIAFLQRCQNLPGTNDQPWAQHAGTNDIGGFIYMPGPPALSFADDEPRPDNAQPLRSYGSMSYAGLKSYIYAELKKNDPRVIAAMDWVKRNYALDENPGMGPQGLFYYLHTVAKALTVYGDDTLTDAKGRTHDWRYEMLKKFVTLQKAGGFWQNENNRWMENDPVLCTTYSLLALEILQSRRYP
jgi:squalene-hopene/tetraprenyl-beta-curcumene cyclase